MSRLIDADALIDDIKNNLWDWETVDGITATTVLKQTISDIGNQPTIEERKTGKWIDYTEDGYVECPFCHSATNCDGNIEELHFCFSCGAMLMEEQP